MKYITYISCFSIISFFFYNFNNRTTDINFKSDSMSVPNDSISIMLIENNSTIQYTSFNENGTKVNNTIKDVELQIFINNHKKKFCKELFLKNINDLKEFIITEAKIENFSNEQISALITICKPDSDNCYFFKLLWLFQKDDYIIEEFEYPEDEEW